MASINRKIKNDRVTHEGAQAHAINSYQELRRSVLSCLLWESQFYEDGVSIAQRIADLCMKVNPGHIKALAIEARTKQHLRHVPLLLLICLAKRGELDSETVNAVIQRPDEMTELVSLYWMNGKQSIPAQMKKGLAKAFKRFDEYRLAKYNRKKEIKLLDVMRLVHPKPDNKEQAEMWGRLKDGKLKAPDTWEVALSGGSNKKETFERLMREKKLGGLAFLRNLRNMINAGVQKESISEYMSIANFSKILPFRFITAAKYNPDIEDIIEQGLFSCCSSQIKLTGKTILIIDVSGSMYGSDLSNYSELDRAEVACALAVLIRELCEEPYIYATAGNDSTRIHKTQKVPARRGFALKDAVYGLCQPLGGGGIFLKQVMDYVKEKEKKADRVIVITDEQDCGKGGDDSPLKANTFGLKNYIINVASYQNGIGYGKWVHIDGWSESVIEFIKEYERQFK